MTGIQPIQSLIFEIRGQRVMLDCDLAMLYGVETKALNQAVKRNAARFEGDDFMFRLTKDEVIYAASLVPVFSAEQDAEELCLRVCQNTVSTFSQRIGQIRRIP